MTEYMVITILSSTFGGAVGYLVIKALAHKCNLLQCIGICFVTISLSTMFFTYVVRAGAANQEAKDLAKTIWTQQMTDNKCKITSFVATRNYITDVWTCPDGRVVLGYSQ